MSASEQSPADLAKIIDAAYDNYLADYSEAGVCVDSNAARAIVAAGFKSPSEVEQLIRQARAEAWNEAVTALDATCGGSHAGMIANPYRFLDTPESQR